MEEEKTDLQSITHDAIANFINSTDESTIADLLLKIATYLVRKTTTNRQIKNQKDLAQKALELVSHIKNENLKELSQLLKELSNAHLKDANVPGSTLSLTISLQKYPTYEELMKRERQEILPFEEVEELINLINNKINSELIKRRASMIIDKLIQLEQKSDQEVLEIYKEFVTNEVIHLTKLEDKSLEKEIVMDPSNMDALLDVVKTVIEETKYKLRVASGYKKLDAILGGGFEAGRVYLFGAKPGGGKSTLMLNLLHNMALYNISKTLLKTDKEPVAVYITLENSELETFERYVRIVTGEELHLYKLKDEEEKLIQDEISSIPYFSKILIKYFKPDTLFSDIFLYVNKLTKNNKQPVVIFIDYLSLIGLPPEMRKERRHELGILTFQLKSMANYFGCPVISPVQLNTAAYSERDKIVIPQMKNLDESRQMAQNADFVGLMFDVPSKEIGGDVALLDLYGDNRKVIGINIDKNRAGATDIIFFEHVLNLYKINELRSDLQDRFKTAVLYSNKSNKQSS